MEPRISVVIPSFNRASTLRRALDSVLDQKRAAQEIIVVDDGSTDNTQEMLAENYPGIRVLAQSNMGVSAARNAGIRAASGDWIALLDSDDEWLPARLQKQVNCLDQNPEAVLLHSDEIWIRSGKRVNAMNKHRKYGGNIFKRCLPLCAISPSASLIRKSVLEEIGLFDENLPACEDYDLWLRICARYPVHYLDEALIIKYGGHEDQLSRQHWGMDRFRVVALQKIIDSDVLDTDDRNAAISTLCDKAGILAAGANKRGRHQDAQTWIELEAKYQDLKSAC